MKYIGQPSFITKLITEKQAMKRGFGVSPKQKQENIFPQVCLYFNVSAEHLFVLKYVCSLTLPLQQRYAKYVSSYH